MPSSTGRRRTLSTEVGETRAGVRSALAEWGIRPSKRFGQNFLVDRSVISAVLDEVGRLGPGLLVEIGPGLGALTRGLAEQVARLVVVEIDRRLAERLREVFGRSPSVEIVQQDILEFDLVRFLPTPETKVVIVGSIPYSLTSSILQWLVERRRWIDAAVLITQVEVAEKVEASPGPEGTALGTFVQAYGDVRILRKIPRGAFEPVPEVDSCLWLVRPHGEPKFKASPEAFFRVVRAVYGARRKTLRNALARALAIDGRAAEEVLRGAGFDSSVRGETLSLAELDRVAQAFDVGPAHPAVK
jgi:16S rRNA (adenine1518-N6/adenine1519-N6)-dimethyltransferase